MTADNEAVYRFEVTVDDLLPVQHLQAPQERVGEATDESEAEALEVVFFDELVQVHSENARAQKVVCKIFSLFAFS